MMAIENHDLSLLLVNKNKRNIEGRFEEFSGYQGNVEDFYDVRVKQLSFRSKRSHPYRTAASPAIWIFRICSYRGRVTGRLIQLNDGVRFSVRLEKTRSQ